MTPSPSVPVALSDTLNVVASDHRPFSAKQKAMGREDFTKIPHGVSGVQDRMNIIWERGVVRAGAAALRVARGPIRQRSRVLTALPPRRWGAKWTRTVSWPSPAPTRPSCTTCTPARAASCPAPTPMWWCGTPRPPGGRGARGDGVGAAGQRSAPRFSPASRTISASTQVQGGDVNLYENMRCHGVPLVTISRGRVVYENGVFMCAEGTGRFCPLRSFPDCVYKKLVQREKVRGAGTCRQQ